MIQVDEARRRLLDAAAPLPPVVVPLAQALGRVLAEEIVADRDIPATDRSAMDGYAVRVADLPTAGATLRVTGEIRAGTPVEGRNVGPGEALRIFTGAPVPPGADAVVMVERTLEDHASGTVVVSESPRTGQNIRRRGEEIRAGETILRAGAMVRAAEIAALAAVGAVHLRVAGVPRMAILSTGDELVAPEETPAPHQLRNSNAPMLAALLAELGLGSREIGAARDDGAALDRALEEGLAADVLLVTGGVSVGAYDLVGQALGRAGLEILFHGVAMKPGKPILAGRRGGTLVVGLPGNPVSAFTGFHVLVAPAIRRMMGRASTGPTVLRARLGGRTERRPRLTTFALAAVTLEAGGLVARPVRTTSSGDVISISRANAFVVAPPASEPLESGAEVEVLPWRDPDPGGC